MSDGRAPDLRVVGTHDRDVAHVSHAVSPAARGVVSLLPQDLPLASEPTGADADRARILDQLRDASARADRAVFLGEVLGLDQVGDPSEA